jgi:hypothetical protein
MFEKEKLNKKDNKDRGEPSRLVAKKAFVISHNEYFREIKAGDELSDVPEQYLTNLKTEGVI